MRLFLPAALASLGAGALFVAACGGGGGGTAPGATQPKAGTDTKAAATAPAQTQKTDAKADTQAAAKAATGKATGEPIKIGQFNDRSGPTANVGTKLGDGFQHWIELVNNTQGGIKGRPVEAIEIDHKYEVPLAVDGYKRLVTRDNVPQILSFGTPITDALAPSANQDKVVLWTPGYGVSETANGEKFPYVFVGVATYYSQAAAAMQFIADDWKAQGKTGNPKVVYSFYDNPAGRDPLELITTAASGIGLDIIDTVAVPATTVDMTTIQTQIKDKNPDYNLTHYFGRTPALSLQAAEKVGFPREKMISMVWGISQDEIEVAKQGAEGYRGLQFTALPSDNPQAYQMIREYRQAAGLGDEPKMNSVWYARGVATAALMVEAMRLADDPTTGEGIKKGAESIKDFTAYGMSKGTTLTEKDHGGSRFLRMYEVRNQDLVRVKDWFEGPVTETEASHLPR